MFPGGFEVEGECATGCAFQVRSEYTYCNLLPVLRPHIYSGIIVISFAYCYFGCPEFVFQLHFKIAVRISKCRLQVPLFIHTRIADAFAGFSVNNITTDYIIILVWCFLWWCRLIFRKAQNNIIATDAVSIRFLNSNSSTCLTGLFAYRYTYKTIFLKNITVVRKIKIALVTDDLQHIVQRLVFYINTN